MSIANNFPEIRPSLNLDFANVKALDSRVTFSRPTVGTYYDGKSVAKAEENLVLYSQEFENAAWTKQSVTVTANTVVAPDGTTTAETFTNSATTTAFWVYRSIASTPISSSLSVFAKKGTTEFLGLGSSNAGGGSAVFNLDTGVVSSTAYVTASIQSVGNGWYRCSIRNDTFAGTYFIISVLESDAGAGAIGSYTGTGKDLYIWGAQLEQRDTVTAYTPTTTQPITNYIPTLLTAPANTARFDHNPTTGESLGLLVEEQRTNLLVRSEEFDNAYWIKNDSTITPNAVVAPDGSLTADKLVENTATIQHLVGQDIFVGVLSNYTVSYSVYVKPNGRNWCILQVVSGGVVYSTVWINIQTGTIGSTLNSGVSNVTHSVKNAGNGFYKVGITATLSSVPTGIIKAQVWLATSDSNTTYTGDGYSGIFIWGAQLEAGAFPTSYIKTEASQVTRSADNASMTGANFSEWYRQDEGTVYVDYAAEQTNGSPWELTQDGANRMVTVSGANAVFLVLIANSFVVSNLNFVNQPPAKWASAFKSGNYGVSYNGSTALTNNYGSTLTNVSVLQIGASTGGNVALNGTIKKIAYYPQRLTNTQLQALTS